VNDPVLWTTIAPADAIEISLPEVGIIGPLNEMGDPCPWPWDPPQRAETPIGLYHCPFCGAMVVAGMDHTDYRERLERPEEPS
jgi:hypothetical protein